MNKIKISPKLYNIVEIKNLKELLNNSAETYSKNIAFKFKDEQEGRINSKTYEELLKDVNNFGTALINLGLKNKKIAIIGNNSYLWCVSYLATVCGTGIVVPIDKSLPKNEIKNLLKISEVEAVCFEHKYIEIMNEIKDEKNTKIKHFISFSNNLPNLLEKGKELIKNGDTTFIDAKINDKEMSILLFTSGTTSLSKAVMLSHYNICSNIIGLASVLKFSKSDTLLSFLPIHHTFECTVTFLTGLYSGVCLGVCEGIRYIAQNLVDYKVSVFVTVPLVLENIYKKIVAQKEQLGDKITNKDILNSLGGNLRLALVGAAPISKEVIIGFNKLGINTLQGYGLTETAPVLCLENDEYKCPGSIGLAVPNVEMVIDNPDENGLGEIIAKGPNVMLGYYNNPEATNEVLKNGWFYTGDLGYVNEDGFLFITGRKKNVIVLKNGKNIFPEEIEVVINNNPMVAESFVYSRIAKDNDLEICAKVVYNKENLLGKSEEEIYNLMKDYIKVVNKTLPLFKYIRHFTISDEPLAKTTTNKIKRYEEMKKLQ